ncbi:MAG: peptide chain release factor N(5)-glutamine methyltransferase [Acidobacteriales bacterium]|nr:peptide chain release factor N(5)-glutamine methyltransferase [Terriglobales bacterium]
MPVANNSLQLREALAAAINLLDTSHMGSPRLNAELLLMFTLNCDRAYLYAHPEQPLLPEEILRYQGAIDERASGMPAQYITGHQEFWGMDFIVNPSVLIPRPETEHLIEALLPLAREIDNPKIADVGTGSGCIAVVLAKELPDAEIHAIDISQAALEIARANAVRHQLDGRIQFHENDLLGGLDIGKLDFVVSNPPYVGESEEDQVQLEVRRFEPRNAVFAGSSGLEIIDRLVPEAHDCLESGGWLVMEISGTIATRVPGILCAWDEVQIIHDLSGIPRVSLARRP